MAAAPKNQTALLQLRPQDFLIRLFIKPHDDGLAFDNRRCPQISSRPQHQLANFLIAEGFLFQIHLDNFLALGGIQLTCRGQ